MFHRAGADEFRCLAAGDFDMSWVFGARAGTATISNLDGRTFQGPIDGVTGINRRLFEGARAGAGAAGARGSFFRDGADPVAGVDGDFYVDSADYVPRGPSPGSAEGPAAHMAPARTMPAPAACARLKNIVDP